MITASALATVLDRLGALRATGEVRIVLAYETACAAVWAAEMIQRIQRRRTVPVSLRVSPRSFASLENPAGRSAAVEQVAESDLLLVAFGDARALASRRVRAWLRDCRARRKRRTLAIAAVPIPHAARGLRLEDRWNWIGPGAGGGPAIGRSNPAAVVGR